MHETTALIREIVRDQDASLLDDRLRAQLGASTLRPDLMRECRP